MVQLMDWKTIYRILNVKLIGSSEIVFKIEDNLSIFN